MEDTIRMIFVDFDKCKPKACKQECRKCCPVNKSGKLCIEVTPASEIASFRENLCIEGCDNCVVRCPFGAVKVLTMSRKYGHLTIHRYGLNSFKLHRIPILKEGQVLGIAGTNGTGKTTALQILAGKLKPNFGNFDNPPDWVDVIKYFKGSEMQKFFTNLLEHELKATIKPQYVEGIGKFVKGKVKDVIFAKDERKISHAVIKELNFEHLLEREIKDLSGGELQRFAILIVSIQNKAIYLFDEPSSYLDIKQRLRVAECIRNCIRSETYVAVVDHDLCMLDYVSDFVCCQYGEPGHYGIVTTPFSVKDGINVFLAGFNPAENVKFRDTALNFHIVEDVSWDKASIAEHNYPKLEKSLGEFLLKVEAGSFKSSQIVVILGENGTGKTTFMKMLAGMDEEKKLEMPKLKVSYKAQKLAPKFEGTVKHLLIQKLGKDFNKGPFYSNVLKPLQIDVLLNTEVQRMSGGEIQRLALALCLAKPADIYLIDEPSAYLDAEKRTVVSKVLKKFTQDSKKACFVVEHDFIMATYLADLVMVCEGTPGKECLINSPQPLVSGMNKFLSLVGITFRRDPTNFRPKINKLNSQKDKEQKMSGNFFGLED